MNSSSLDHKGSDSWWRVVNSSAIFLSAKLFAGTISTVLLYNIFLSPTIVLIKQISLMQQLPSVFSFGVKNKIHDDVITGGDRVSLFSNLIFIKVCSFFGAVFVILLGQTVPWSFNLPGEILVLSVLLLALCVVNDVLYSVLFTRGKLAYLINLMTLKTFTMPVVFFFFGAKYQIYTWVWAMLAFELAQFFILVHYGALKNSIFVVNMISREKLKSLFKRSIVFDLNSRLGLVFEIFLFFVVANELGVFEAALLSFMIRVSQTMTNIIGQTIQKKTLYEVIELVGGADIKRLNIAGLNTLTAHYLGVCFLCLLLVTAAYMVITFFFIDKFSAYFLFVVCCLPLAMLRLANIILLRVILIRDDTPRLLLALVINSFIFVAAAFLVSEVAETALTVCFVLCGMSIMRCVAFYMLCSGSIGSRLSFPSFASVVFYASATLGSLVVLAKSPNAISISDPATMAVVLCAGLTAIFFLPSAVAFFTSNLQQEKESL